MGYESRLLALGLWLLAAVGKWLNVCFSEAEKIQRRKSNQFTQFPKGQEPMAKGY